MSVRRRLSGRDSCAQNPAATPGLLATRRCVAQAPNNGFTLVDLVVSLAVLAMILIIGIPALLNATARIRVQLAASEIAAVLRLTRIKAIESGRHVAIRFWEEDDGRVTWAMFLDGDGDGVRNEDIRRRIDPALGPRRPLLRISHNVRPGFPRDLVPTDPSDPGRRLDRLHDPVRFNRSGLASFGPLGTSTPGSIYLSDGKRALAAVRLYGRTGKVRVIRYDADEEIWR